MALADSLVEQAAAIGLGIIGVATAAVIVSRKSNTAGVVQSLGSAFGNTLGVAEAPVTGASMNLNLSYPNSAGLSGFGGGASAFG